MKKDKNPIKPLFKMTDFAAKQWLSVQDYILHIAQRSIDCGLITDDEFKKWMASFKKLKLNPYATCQAFDTIIKKRWEERDSDNYFHENNRLESERNSYYNSLVKKQK